MAYTPGTDKPICWVPRLGSTPAVWYYAHASDAHGTISGAGYFTDGANYGLKANDVMFVLDIDTATCTIHIVTSATTIGTATL